MKRPIEGIASAVPKMILADENIPAAREIFASTGEVRTFSGREISAGDLQGVSVLLVRSVTRVDESLLKGSRVQFVGSATIGTDHVDLEYLRTRRIAFAHAPGSNADSVVEYVVAAILRLCVYHRRPLEGLEVGIVGCGQIGGRLSKRLARLGAAVMLNDPPLAERCEREGKSHNFRPMHEVLARADVITLHVPLEREGKHSTAHLIASDGLRSMKRGAWLINTSRGPVVDNNALKHALLNEQSISSAVLDVWEDEPEPDVELIGATALATPHIAGYAYDAKLRGTLMLYRALNQHLQRGDGSEVTYSPADVPSRIRIGSPDGTLPTTEWLDLFVRKMYDIERDDAALRKLAQESDTVVSGRQFAALRRDYPTRREFGVYAAPSSAVVTSRHEVVERGLGVTLM